MDVGRAERAEVVDALGESGAPAFFRGVGKVFAAVAVVADEDRPLPADELAFPGLPLDAEDGTVARAVDRPPREEVAEVFVFEPGFLVDERGMGVKRTV